MDNCFTPRQRPLRLHLLSRAVMVRRIAALSLPSGWGAAAMKQIEGRKQGRADRCMRNRLKWGGFRSSRTRKRWS